MDVTLKTKLLEFRLRGNDGLEEAAGQRIRRDFPLVMPLNGTRQIPRFTRDDTQEMHGSLASDTAAP